MADTEPNDISSDVMEFRYGLVEHLFTARAGSLETGPANKLDVYSSTIRDLQRTLQESLVIREDQLSVLNSLMVKMMTYQELDPLLQHIAEIMIEHTIASNALILLVDETDEFIQVVASAGSHSHQNSGERRYRGVGFAGIAWDTGETQYIHNSDCNIKTRGFWPSGTQLIAEPLLFDGDVIGVTVLGSPTDAIDFRSSCGLVNNLASLAAIAIANAQSMEQSRAELLRMRALSDISKQLILLENIDDLLSSVTRALMDAMDINRTTGFRVQANGQLVIEAAWMKSGDEVLVSRNLPKVLIAESICAWCFDQRKFASVLRNVNDPRESDRIHLLREELGIGATLCMPIVSGKKVVGILSVSRDSSRRNFDENEINLFCSIVNQVSSTFVARQMSDALQFQADHDSLTQLPNRRCFERQLKEHLDTSLSVPKLFAVLFLDLDGFKAVNDTLGHNHGDQLLQLVASRLRKNLGEGHLLARIGGDEFAIIARHLIDRQQSIAMAVRLSEALQEPFDIEGAVIRISTSIGISFYPSNSECADELLRYSDEAMYQAKTKIGPRIVCFHESMAQATQNRLELESELREAIIEQQFVLHYQPQVDVERGRVDSVEALIRWNSPHRGLVSPGLFIPIAEETGLINVIGSWVLDEAIRQLATWKHGPLAHLRIGVNIAAPQFLEEGFCNNLLRSLSQAGVCSSHLEIEVTESIVMKDVRIVIRILERLRTAGIRVSIDDFGTGYSSLSYLRNLPLDTLKIDRAFMQYESTDQIDYTLVNTIVLLAEGLGLSTIAEGVESEKQLQQLMDLGVSVIQGFLFAKPGPECDLQATIDDIESRVLSMRCCDERQLKIGNG